jgi:hypothetical protein
MKFNCGPTWAERIDRRKQWHRWFAWFPVRIGETRECLWLEYVERKGECHCYYDCYWSFEYRPVVNGGEKHGG